MDASRYEPKQIEPKWQELWAREGTWEVSNEPDDREKSYILEMLPYPSGEPHIGHLKNYALGDAIAHFHRRIGQRVLHPMGYDAFGLPAENNAIKTASTRATRPTSRSPPIGTGSTGGGSRSTGAASCRPRTRPITAGRSGSS